MSRVRNGRRCAQKLGAAMEKEVQLRRLAAVVQQGMERIWQAKREKQRAEKQLASSDRAGKRHKTQSAPAPTTLHTLGYELHRAAVSIPHPAIAQLKAQAATRNPHRDAIFNHLAERRDDRRRTQFSPRHVDGLLGEVEAFLDRAGYLAKHRANEWKAVQSRSGCVAQPAHCDYSPDSLLGLPDKQMPLFVLVALMPNTRLHVWPNSIRLITDARRAQRCAQIAPQTLELAAGDVFVGRADLVHAGAAYAEQHFRLHCFLDTTACQRPPNDTYVIHRDAEPAVRAAIQQ